MLQHVAQTLASCLSACSRNVSKGSAGHGRNGFQGREEVGKKICKGFSFPTGLCDCPITAVLLTSLWFCISTSLSCECSTSHLLWGLSSEVSLQHWSFRALCKVTGFSLALQSGVLLLVPLSQHWDLPPPWQLQSQNWWFMCLCKRVNNYFTVLESLTHRIQDEIIPHITRSQ